MAKYEVTIIDDGRKLLAMALRKEKNELVCESTFELPHDLYQYTSEGKKQQNEEDIDQIFSDEDASASEFDETELSDELELEGDDQPSLPANRMIGWLESLGNAKFEVTYVPNPRQVSYFLFKDQNYTRLKKKELHKQISEKLQEIADLNVAPENYSYRFRSDGALLVAVMDDRMAGVQMMEELSVHFGQKLWVRAFIPQEELLIDMIKSREAEDATILHLQQDAGRVLMIEDGRLTLPVNLDMTSDDYATRAREIVQRLLFEIEKGTIESLSRVFVSASPDEIDEITRLLQQNVPDLEVESLTSEYAANQSEASEEIEEADEFGIVDSSEEESRNAQSMSLGYAALQAAGKDSVIIFLPTRILEKQQVLKLKWHGVVLLLLLAATPWALHEMYLEKSERYQELQSEQQQLQAQIDEALPIVEEMEVLSEEFEMARAELSSLEQDARYSTKWTQLLTELQQEMTNIGNTWFTDYQSGGENSVILEGYTIYRERVNDVAGIYPNSRIERVQQGEMRGHPIFAFTIRVSGINDHIDPPRDLDEQLLTETED